MKSSMPGTRVLAILGVGLVVIAAIVSLSSFIKEQCSIGIIPYVIAYEKAINLARDSASCKRIYILADKNKVSTQAADVIKDALTTRLNKNGILHLEWYNQDIDYGGRSRGTRNPKECLVHANVRSWTTRRAVFKVGYHKSAHAAGAWRIILTKAPGNEWTIDEIEFLGGA